MAKNMDYVLLETIVAIVLAFVLADAKPRCLYNLHNRYLVAKCYNPVKNH
jgi:hypothetical protein